MNFNFAYYFYNIKKFFVNLFGDWGLGIGDWGFGGWAQAPTPTTPTPKPTLKI